MRWRAPSYNTDINGLVGGCATGALKGKPEGDTECRKSDAKRKSSLLRQILLSQIINGDEAQVCPTTINLYGVAKPVLHATDLPSGVLNDPVDSLEQLLLQHLPCAPE
jgi:hypothetical protein